MRRLSARPVFLARVLNFFKRCIRVLPVPHKEGQITAVSECSNRGNCDREEGICKCYSGYVGVDCSVQNILALSDADKATLSNQKKKSKK